MDAERFSRVSIVQTSPDRPIPRTPGFAVRTAWRVIALIFAVTSLMLALTATLALTPEAGPNRISLLAFAAAGQLLAAAWWYCGRRRLTGKALHLPMVGALGLVGGGMVVAGDDASVLLLLYTGPLVFSALFMSLRVVTAYLGVVCVAVAAFAVGGGSELVSLRALVTGGTLVAVTAFTATARWQIDRVAMHALQLSGRDPLTGLANLRRLYERLDIELARTDRTGATVILFMIDLDDFKSVNDLYSHSIGDATLRAVAAALTETARSDEIVARRGGDEFVVVTSMRSPEDAELMAQRIQAAIYRARQEISPEVVATASVGFSVRTDHEPASALLARADAELHEAKRPSRRGESYFRVERLSGSDSGQSSAAVRHEDLT